MQVWKKLGLLFENKHAAYTHAALPIAKLIAGDIYTVFFTARDEKNQSIPFSLVLDLNSLKILDVTKLPLLSIGAPGEFDAHGIMPTCLISRNDSLYLFYIGWNRASDVPFRNAIGLATSTDGGRTFSKYSQGPLIDRGPFDPCFVASCDVLQEENKFSMWYLSAVKWEWVNNHWRHFYHIKYASSPDLINWERKGGVAIDFIDSQEYAISTPRVLKSNSGIYRMWYSHRGSMHNQTYRIGYAESENGINWVRKDTEVILPVSDAGWDSEMICYPFIFKHKNNLFMVYNGNGYGKTGFGLAVLENE